MSPPRQRVGVAGVGRTGPVPEDPRSIPELVLDAVQAALAAAGLALSDVDAVVTSSVDLYDGLTASNVAVTEVVGAVMKPETRIAGDGLCAAIHGVCQVLSGAYDTVLVVAHGKASMAAHPELSTWAMDPLLLQPLGVDFRTCAALEARVVAAADPEAPTRWAELAAARLRAAGRSLTAAEVLASPPSATPLRAAMEAPLADGAYAVVLQRTPGALWVSGCGHDLATHDPGARDLSCWQGLSRAADRARALAGLTPGAAFDLAEPCCRHPHTEQLFFEATGLDPATHCSPSGGLFQGDVPAAAGLGRLVDAVLWLRRHGGRALAHGTWGPAGQGQAVAILEAAA